MCLKPYDGPLKSTDSPCYIQAEPPLPETPFSRNDPYNAESALRTASERAPSLAEPYLNLAVIAMRRNQAVKALELIEKAASLEDSCLAYLNKGDALLQLGRHAEAIHEHSRAIEIGPDLLQLKEQAEKRLQHLRSIEKFP